MTLFVLGTQQRDVRTRLRERAGQAVVLAAQQQAQRVLQQGLQQQHGGARGRVV